MDRKKSPSTHSVSENPLFICQSSQRESTSEVNQSKVSWLCNKMGRLLVACGIVALEACTPTTEPIVPSRPGIEMLNPEEKWGMSLPSEVEMSRYVVQLRKCFEGNTIVTQDISLDEVLQLHHRYQAAWLERENDTLHLPHLEGVENISLMSPLEFEKLFKKFLQQLPQPFVGNPALKAIRFEALGEKGGSVTSNAKFKAAEQTIIINTDYMNSSEAAFIDTFSQVIQSISRLGNWYSAGYLRDEESIRLMYIVKKLSTQTGKPAFNSFDKTNCDSNNNVLFNAQEHYFTSLLSEALQTDGVDIADWETNLENTLRGKILMTKESIAAQNVRFISAVLRNVLAPGFNVVKSFKARQKIIAEVSKSIGVAFYRKSLASIKDADMRAFFDEILSYPENKWKKEEINAQAYFSRFTDPGLQHIYAEKVFDKEADFSDIKTVEEKALCIHWLAEMQRLLKTRSYAWKKGDMAIDEVIFFSSQANLQTLQALFEKIPTNRQKILKQKLISFTKKVLHGYRTAGEDDPNQYLWDVRTILAEK